MKKFQTRGPKTGQCNICGDLGLLTEDHTPPKGSVRIKQVEMLHITSLLSAERAGVRGRISQNGVKFRTLCNRCNNTILGSNYDLAFNEFSQNVTSYLKSNLVLPETVNVRGKPQKIARALFGHLTAIGIDRYKKGKNTEDLKDWFLDESRPLPDYLSIHYWVYPYQTQVLIRDGGLRNLRVQDPAVIWLMKFFPIAFSSSFSSPILLSLYNNHRVKASGLNWQSHKQ